MRLRSCHRCHADGLEVAPLLRRVRDGRRARLPGRTGGATSPAPADATRLAPAPARRHDRCWLGRVRPRRRVAIPSSATVNWAVGAAASDVTSDGGYALGNVVDTTDSCRHDAPFIRLNCRSTSVRSREGFFVG